MHKVYKIQLSNFTPDPNPRWVRGGLLLFPGSSSTYYRYTGGGRRGRRNGEAKHQICTQKRKRRRRRGGKMKSPQASAAEGGREAPTLTGRCMIDLDSRLWMLPRPSKLRCRCKKVGGSGGKRGGRKRNFLTPPPTFPFLARGEKSGGTGEMDPTVCLFPVYPDILIETSLARPRNQSRASTGRGKEEFSYSIFTPATFRFRIRRRLPLTSQYWNDEALK